MGLFKKDKVLVSVEPAFNPLKYIANGMREKIDQLKKEDKLLVSNLSTALICDYITLDYAVFGLSEYQCMDELSERVRFASLEEILALFRFLGDRNRFFQQYVFTIKFVLHKLLLREDRVDFFREFRDAGGFHLLNIQIDVHRFMQYSQNYQEKT